ncbi:hypothetical protein CK203_031354 [Vitis vinifera]|uniref:Uncharacterized protein n=1 Tax=Vitis vinifera TaxID=29760 RepID=A0A438IX65_VITVI|nr:hypothetical protein CK203_031354 [Vitis vinifera]
MVAYHLSRLAIAHNSHGSPINDDFPEKSLMLVQVAPWYPNNSNEIVELLNFNSTRSFKMNGHRLKPFVEPFSHDKEEFILLDPHQA